MGHDIVEYALLCEIERAGIVASVGVVLINWNGGEFTIPCIRSLLAGLAKPDRIVVVDNASVDGSPDRIRDTFPQVAIMRNPVNVGFAAGNNLGIEFLLQEGMDYIWILNNDTVVADDCLTTLLEAARKNPQAAGLSGKILCYDQPGDPVWYAGAVRHPLHCAPKHLLKPILDERSVNGVVEVDFISGCCMFVPSRILERFGGFVGSYTAYSEDSEWCWRIRRDEQKLFYVPVARLWHRVSASTRKNLGQDEAIPVYALYLMIRNHLWTVRKHAGKLSKWCCLVVNLGIQIRNVFSDVARGRMRAARSSLRGLVSGLLDPVPDDIPVWTRRMR